MGEGKPGYETVSSPLNTSLLCNVAFRNFVIEQTSKQSYVHHSDQTSCSARRSGASTNSEGPDSLPGNPIFGLQICLTYSTINSVKCFGLPSKQKLSPKELLAYDLLKHICCFKIF